MGLKQKAINGVFWMFSGTVGAGLLNFFLTMFFARILSPQDFGLIELLTIFTVISEVFVDSGFSQALIRDQNAKQIDFSSIFYFNITIALLLYLLLFISAPLISSFYNSPILKNLSRFVFLNIIFHSSSIIQNTYFARNIQFRPQAIASFLSVILAGLISIILALNRYGVWALASNLVLFAFFKMVFYWAYSPWRPILSFSFFSLKKYYKFGINLLIQGIIDKFVTNLESLIIGKVYTKTDLGYFSQARKLDSYLISTCTAVIQKVSYPLLSKINSGAEDLKNGYRRVLGITMFGMIPIMLFISTCADNILYCVFGPQWGESVPYLRIWSIIGLFVSFYTIFINVFLVKDKTKELLYISILRQSLRILTIIILIRISIMALLYGIFVVTIISTILYTYFGGRYINYSSKEIMKDLLPTILSSIIAASIAYSVILIPIVSKYLLLSIQLFVMVSSYVCINHFFKNQSLYETIDIIRNLTLRKKER